MSIFQLFPSDCITLYINDKELVITIGKLLSGDNTVVEITATAEEITATVVEITATAEADTFTLFADRCINN